MREPEVWVRFQPSGRSVQVLRGTPLDEAAARADLALPSPCGGAGLCGKCRLIVRLGAAEPTPAERRWFSDEELRSGWRLACQTTVVGPTEVVVPAHPTAEHQILVDSDGLTRLALDPPIFQQFTDTPPVDALAVAVDLGTTTLVGSLVELATGERRVIDALLNPQTRFGDDVLSRIALVRRDPDALGLLCKAIAVAVDEMIGALCRQSGASREQVLEISVAGNTTMQQLFAGIDPSPLGELPFAPSILESQSRPAAELGIHIHPRGQAYIMPVIGGFVGGDTVAGILATGLADVEHPTLFVDIGTNGEIVLAADGKLSAASTAAGPAFEGARISCGMRGSTGAIEKVVADDDGLRIGVIGDVPPVGLCGSGLIDAVAALLDHGVLTPQGRLLAPDQLPPNVPADLARRVVLHEDQVSFLLASADEAADQRPIVLNQRDIRELQLAAGAIRAGIQILLRRRGLEAKDLDGLWIGGGFGNYIRRDNAQRIGLLPREIEHHRIRYLGNTSLAGARLAALSSAARQSTEAIARRTEHVDLSSDAEFHRAFTDAMTFPES